MVVMQWDTVSWGDYQPQRSRDLLNWENWGGLMRGKNGVGAIADSVVFGESYFYRVHATKLENATGVITP
jgi:hypothetical protein